jgi:hypothetical protein
MLNLNNMSKSLPLLDTFLKEAKETLEGFMQSDQTPTDIKEAIAQVQNDLNDKKDLNLKTLYELRDKYTRP